MIALIGEKELWRGFIPLGVKVFETENKEQILSAINTVKTENYDFIFLSEYVASLIEDMLDDLTKENILNIVLLPSIDTTKKNTEDQLYFKRMKKVVEKAMGVDILSK
jgi:vacuolar-type H+-ATPase subunit F/Vma7